MSERELIWNLSASCTDAQWKMVGAQRFGHLGFYTISRDGVSKSAKKKKDSVIK